MTASGSSTVRISICQRSNDFTTVPLPELPPPSRRGSPGGPPALQPGPTPHHRRPTPGDRRVRCDLGGRADSRCYFQRAAGSAVVNLLTRHLNSAKSFAHLTMKRKSASQTGFLQFTHLWSACLHFYLESLWRFTMATRPTHGCKGGSNVGEHIRAGYA